PEVAAVLVEEPEPEAPYGAKGVGEPPLISSPAAIVAAMRAATGRRLNRVPVSPEELAGLSECRPGWLVRPGQSPAEAVRPAPPLRVPPLAPAPAASRPCSGRRAAARAGPGAAPTSR